MIETQQTVAIAAGIDNTWDYSKNFERWASSMPGYQTSEIEDEDNSLWILKVGVGAMVRVVKVRVHVEEWDGPERVTFSFRLEGDPVVGSGSYVASALSEKQTEVTLHVRVEGSGPMAPMWEAMGAPVLNKFAKSFALDLKARIEEHAGSPGIADQVSTSRTTDSASSRFWRWLRAIFTGRKAC